MTRCNVQLRALCAGKVRRGRAWGVRAPRSHECDLRIPKQACTSPASCRSSRRVSEHEDSACSARTIAWDVSGMATAGVSLGYPTGRERSLRHFGMRHPAGASLGYPRWSCEVLRTSLGQRHPPPLRYLEDCRCGCIPWICPLVAGGP